MTGPRNADPAAASVVGAPTRRGELGRQRDKIAAAMVAIEADIFGVLEIENNPSASLVDLLRGLNAVAGADTYTYVDTGTIGGDAIKVGLIYRPASVTPIGPHAIIDSSVDTTFVDTKNRPGLIQTFEQVATGERFTVANNHFKSKGSDCGGLGDPDLHDGQGNCNGTRTSAAVALARYLATDPTAAGDPDILIMGDLNAYAREDPIRTLEAAGYTDLIGRFVGTGAYSFVFDGRLGYLDHALANESLLGQVTGVTEWHINADEPPLFDYNDGVHDPGERGVPAGVDRTAHLRGQPLPVVGPRSGDHRSASRERLEPGADPDRRGSSGRDTLHRPGRRVGRPPPQHRPHLRTRYNNRHVGHHVLAPQACFATAGGLLPRPDVQGGGRRRRSGGRDTLHRPGRRVGRPPPQHRPHLRPGNNDGYGAFQVLAPRLR